MLIRRRRFASSRYSVLSVLPSRPSAVSCRSRLPELDYLHSAREYREFARPRLEYGFPSNIYVVYNYLCTLSKFPRVNLTRRKWKFAGGDGEKIPPLEIARVNVSLRTQLYFNSCEVCLFSPINYSRSGRIRE